MMNRLKTPLALLATLFSLQVAKAQVCFNPINSFTFSDMNAYSFCQADFNGDSKPDFVTANANGVSIFLQQSNGSFIDTKVDSNILTNTLCTTDFNNDGKMDIAYFEYGPGLISILLGNGNGTFAAPSKTNVGLFYFNNSICTSDFNGDGKPDIALSTSFNKVLIMLGMGNGTFGAATAVMTTSLVAGQLITADFNNDGKTDLATSSKVLLGDGMGGFISKPSFSTPNASIVSADFNNDGSIDIIVNDIPDSLAHFQGNGSGDYNNYVSIKTIDSSVYAGTNKNLLCVGDFNNDGNKDLAIAESKLVNSVYSSLVTVISGNGNGTFANPVDFSIPNFPRGILAQDVNGDGLSDIAVISAATGDTTQLTILYNCNTPTSVENAQMNNARLSVYPNPCAEFIIIKNAVPGNYFIINSLGQMIQKVYIQEDKQETKLDLSGLSEGLYALSNGTGKVTSFVLHR